MKWFTKFKKRDNHGVKTAQIPVASDYPLVIYLEEGPLVTLAASIEGGISRLSTSHTMTSNESLTGRSTDLGVQIGSAGLSGARDQISKHGESKSESTTKEIPLTAIFVKLRKDLIEAGVVKNISDNIEEIEPGDFIECGIVLRRSTIIDRFDQLKSGMDLFKSVSSILSVNVDNQQATKKAQVQPMEYDTNLITDILNSAFITDDYDWHCKLGEISIIFNSKTSCFLRSLDEIIEGKFYLFGKVFRVIPADSDDKIDLLRNTSIGKFSSIAPDINDHIQEVFSSISDTEEEIITEIGGPAIQIIPIAIYT